MGRGCVGFDLAEIDWGGGTSERARAREFVLSVIDLALRRHRWDELGYDPPFARDYLRRYRTMVESFDMSTAPAPRFPDPAEAATASCVRHRILTGLPHWEACVFCSREW